MGGFTGFCVDVSDAVRERDNVIAVRVDNAHDPNILPGKQVPDFNLYGGLYREAKIVRLDPVHIARHGVAIATPRASDRSATARIEIAIRNEGTAAVDCACEVDIVDGVDGVDRRLMSLVSRGRVNPGGEHRFVLESPEIVDPILWSPDSPHLYRARVRVRKNLDSETSQAGVAEPQPTNTREARVVDEVSVPFGIRWFEFDLEKGFILNGKPLYLRGVNRHQDYPGLGNALPERMQARDAELIREMGGNFVRTSHYPQHPVFLDACDRLGILVYEEIATWQSIGKGDAFADNAERMLRDMIARDRNHPSIILWGLMNEHRSKPLFERLHAAAREADPTRLTIYAENRTDIGKEKGAIGITDVLGINYKLPHLDEIRAELPGIKFLSSEHTNFDTAARGNLEQELAMVEKLANDLDILEARPWISGGALWAMHDYGTDYEPSRPVQHAGVLDAWRIPKEAYYLLCSRWREEPTVHVCGHWTWHGREGETIRVLIVHNCDRVEVFLNDKACGAGGATSPTQFDVPYEPGILRAVGCRGTGENESRVETQIETAGPPVAIRLTAGTGVLRADGRDVAEIAAEIVDRAGRPVPTPAIEIAFEVEGPATLHGIGGIASAPVVDGVGRIALRASDRAGTIRVRAAHPGLEPGRAELRAVDCG